MAGHRHGITNAQARYLARLCRELRQPYPGNGMTLLEASDAIDAAKAELDRRRQTGWKPERSGSDPLRPQGTATAP